MGGNGEALINDGEEKLGRDFFLNMQLVLIRTVKKYEYIND